MGSFSDPTFTLQVSFLDIQGPGSYTAIAWAASPLPHTFKRLSTAPSIAPSKPGSSQPPLGSAGDAWALRRSPAPGTKALLPPGTRGPAKPGASGR